MRNIIKIIIPILLLTIFYCSKPPTIKYPETAKVDQVDDYHGTKVADPYRWLEDMNSPKTAEWIQAQQALTENYLAAIEDRTKIKKRLTGLFNYERFYHVEKAGKYYIYERNDGLQEQDVLYIQEGLDGKPSILLDPNTFSDDGSARLTTYKFSGDYKYLGYGVSYGGSDWREYYVLDVASRKKLDDRVQWVKFSNMSWYKDGFFYSRYDKPSEDVKYKAKVQFQKLYYHRVGTSQDEDLLIHENKKNPAEGFSGVVSDSKKYLVIRGWQGSADFNLLYYKNLEKGLDTEVLPLVDQQLAHCDFIAETGGRFLVKTDYQAPNFRLVLIDPQNRQPEHWQNIIPEGPNKMENVDAAGERLVVTYLKDAVSVLAVFNYKGEHQYDIDLPGLGTVYNINSHQDDNEMIYDFRSYTVPSTYYRCDITTGKSTLFKKPALKFNPDDFETQQVFYESKDKTKIPLFITHKKGITLDGHHPALLYGYGGFNAARRPVFNEYVILWVENGGVFASACLRGGGEYGEKWHRAGMLENKQNVFDDFIAAGEYLVEKGYTSSQKLSIFGGSNGGLLVGAVVNQRPDLFRVAVAAVGVMDMLRYQKFTIGWAWAGEYGSSDNPDQFKYLYKYSPLHNIASNVDYPAVMVTTANRDDRVFPAHSFKYIATLQEKYKGQNPTLIRIETKAGHGGASGTSRRIELYTDILTFIFHNMNIKL